MRRRDQLNTSFLLSRGLCRSLRLPVLGVSSPTGLCTRFGVTSGWAVTRPESWETKISRPATLDECINDYALVEDRLQRNEWYSLSLASVPPHACSLRNVTLGSRRLARRPGVATAAIAEIASKSRAAASTGHSSAPIPGPTHGRECQPQL
jgi:hypothetical protein